MSISTHLTERDICTKFITPAVVQAGWDLQTQIREEVFVAKEELESRSTRSTVWLRAETW